MDENKLVKLTPLVNRAMMNKIRMKRKWVK